MAGGFFEDVSENKKSAEIAEFDSPFGGPQLDFGGQPLNSMNLEWDFDLYVVALTKDTRNGANAIYVGEGSVKWKFDASGAINPNQNYLWTAGPNAGITPPNGGQWQELNNGVQPLTTGERFNDLVLIAGWT